MVYSREGKSVVTKGEILAGLRRLGVEPGDPMFVHSSLSAFGYVDGGAPAVCDALLEAVGEAGTVAVPTFTWNTNHKAQTVVFDVRETPCDVGRVPERFRRLAGAQRSEHACHSIAALGPLAGDIMGDGVRSFAWGSSMYRLYELDFRYVLLGCGFQACTAVHTAEELMQVPYRYYRDFAGSTVIRADGTAMPCRSTTFLCRRPYAPDLTKMQTVLARVGELQATRVGKATIVMMRARSIVDITVGLLKGDIGYLLSDSCRRSFDAHRRQLEADRRWHAEPGRDEAL